MDWRWLQVVLETVDEKGGLFLVQIFSDLEKLDTDLVQQLILDRRKPFAGVFIRKILQNDVLVF